MTTLEFVSALTVTVHDPLCVAATVQAPLWVAAIVLKGVRVVNCEAVRTTGTEPAASACPNAGVLVSILERDVFPVVCNADVEAPVGSDTVPETFVIFQVPLCVAATVLKGVSVLSCEAVSTTGTEPAANACPNAGVLVSILANEVFPVVCNADVAAPVGNGSAA